MFELRSEGEVAIHWTQSLRENFQVEKSIHAKVLRSERAWAGGLKQARRKTTSGDMMQIRLERQVGLALHLPTP